MSSSRNNNNRSLTSNVHQDCRLDRVHSVPGHTGVAPGIGAGDSEDQHDLENIVNVAAVDGGVAG